MYNFKVISKNNLFKKKCVERSNKKSVSDDIIACYDITTPTKGREGG